MKSQIIKIGKKKIKLHINREYEQLVPRPTRIEYSGLKDSIDRDGIREKLVFNSEGTCLDGMTRFRISLKDLKRKIPLNRIDIRTFANKLLEKKFVIESSLRRNLNDYQKSVLALKLLPIEAELAKKRMLKGEKNNPEEVGKSSEKIAKRFGISGTTFYRAKTIYENAPKKVLDKLNKGELEINTAFTKIISSKHNESKKDPPLPKGQFNVIYIDPPWAYSNKVTGGSSQSGSATQYRTMTLQQLKTHWKNKRKIFARKAIMFMWATTPLGKDCQLFLEFLGFKYKTKIYWEKTNINGLGYYYRGVVEELMLGTKGGVRAFRIQQKNIIKAPVGRHSEKPEIFRKLIEKSARKVFTNPQFLELYARGKPIRKWTKYGDELEEINDKGK